MYVNSNGQCSFFCSILHGLPVAEGNRGGAAFSLAAVKCCLKDTNLLHAAFSCLLGSCPVFQHGDGGVVLASSMDSNELPITLQSRGIVFATENLIIRDVPYKLI
jgi:hypothetical protein